MTTKYSKATVFIINDQSAVRRRLARVVRSAGMRAKTFRSAEVFLERKTFTGNGCIVVGIRMWGMSGPELQDRLAEKEYSLPVIFFTGRGNISASVRAMKKGAVDFLQHGAGKEEILAAVTTALERDRSNRRRYLKRKAICSQIAALTPRERQVMELVINGALNKQIAGELGIAEKTVKIHRGRVMKKMRVESVAQLVRACQQGGLIDANGA